MRREDRNDDEMATFSNKVRPTVKLVAVLIAIALRASFLRELYTYT